MQNLYTALKAAGLNARMTEETVTLFTDHVGLEFNQDGSMTFITDEGEMGAAQVAGVVMDWAQRILGGFKPGSMSSKTFSLRIGGHTLTLGFRNRTWDFV